MGRGNAVLSAERHDVPKRRAIRLFKASYLPDPERCLLLDPRALPPVPAETLGRFKDDDRYLLQAQETVPGSIAGTTDQPLLDALRACGRQCSDRENWIAEYLG